MTDFDVARQFTNTTQDKDTRAGKKTLAAGTGTQVTGLTTVDSFHVTSETANVAFATESSGTLTITGTGSDVVNWSAIGTK